MTSNVAITKKNEKKYVRQQLYVYIRDPRGIFKIKLTPDIYGFIDKLMWCPSCTKYFRTWLQINDKMITK